ACPKPRCGLDFSGCALRHPPEKAAIPIQSARWNRPGSHLKSTGANAPEKFRMQRSPFRTAARIALAIAFAVITAHPFDASAQDKPPLTLFAAASLKNALDEINVAWTQKTGVQVRTSYAASSALAKQIEEGAPADLFISADLDWM